MKHRLRGAVARRTAVTRTLLCAAALALCAAPPAHAQTTTSALLPDTVAERIVAFYNMDATTRLSGAARIGPGATVRGGVALLGGSLLIEGEVDGSVVVINGDVTVLPGGRVTGSLTVTGGDATVEPNTVAGEIFIYREPLRYRAHGEVIVYVPPYQEPGLAAGVDLPFGRTELLITSYGAYNRAEGLPVAVGPRVRFGGTHPTRARALLIVRTAARSELDPRRVGFDIRAEQLVAPDLGLTLGASAYSVITPIEAWGLTDRESALATFVLRTDYRDHYEREGWSVLGRLAPPGAPLTLQLEYRDEEHVTVPVADPLSIFRTRGRWRPQPSIAEGALHSLQLSGRYDTRNEQRDPSTGWLIDAHVEKGVGGTLSNAGSYDPDSLGAVARPASATFLHGQIDIRRYARLSPYARLSLRVLAAGSIDGGALPAQRQHALGGEGSLPGYRLFEFDCGARRTTVQLGRETFHPYYGCDRLALVQLEYQAGFPFARRVSEALGLGPSLGYLARWAAFFDAGRAWTDLDAREGRFRGNDDFSVDAGLGVRLGPLGAYWTVPLSGDGHGFNLFVRLRPRI